MAKNDAEVMLTALRREREEAHQRVMQLDRIIKKVKDGDYLPSNKIDGEILTVEKKDSKPPEIFSQNVDIRIQILKVFDIVKKACPLKDIQAEYDRLNGHHYPVRDTMRGLQNSKLIVMIKQKSFTRGFLWAKSDWIENGQIKEEFKPEGFDLLYKPHDLVYE